MDQQKNKWALVTGASSGIGLSYSRELAKRGYCILLVSNQQEELERVAKELQRTYSVATIAYYSDLSKVDAAEELYRYCEEKSLEIVILVNNAGMFFYKDVVDCSLKSVETIVNLHVVTTTKLCRLFGEAMAKRKEGYILNMSSISVYTPFCGIALYTATKSFIRTFSRAFALEMRERGVHVLVVCPGAVATDLYHLSKRLQHLGVQIGVIIPPERLAYRAINRLLHARSEYIPGALNRLYRPLFATLPLGFKLWVRKKTKGLMNPKA